MGAGLFGAVFAQQMRERGKSVIVIEKRNHIGGNCHTEWRNGICVHVYGGHIFHCNNPVVWNYVNRFATFDQYYHRVKVNYQGHVYSFPINLMTLNQLWGVTDPQKACKHLRSVARDILNPANMEEWALSQIGEQLYEMFVRGYTTKQWQTEPRNLPASILRRIPIRLNWNDGYFDDLYQGIPREGYTAMIERMLEGCEVHLNTDYLTDREYFNQRVNQHVYTGCIDEYYEYCFGALPYRTLEFVHQTLETGDYQGCPVINFTGLEVPHTRVLEWKHFMRNPPKSHTIVTTETPVPWTQTATPFYPINTEQNNEQYRKYAALNQYEKNILFGGRLAEYRYYDMHQVIASALARAKEQP